MSPSETEFSLAAVIIVLLLGLATLVLLIVLAVVIGRRAPQVKGWLWLASGLYVAAGLVPFAFSLFSLGDVSTGEMPDEAQLDKMMRLGSIGSLIGQVCQAGIIVCYCVAALRIVRLHDPAQPAKP